MESETQRPGKKKRKKVVITGVIADICCTITWEHVEDHLVRVGLCVWTHPWLFLAPSLSGKESDALVGVLWEIAKAPNNQQVFRL